MEKTSAQERTVLSPDAVLFTEARPELLDRVWHLNAAAWAEPLNVETYTQRERFLSQQDLTKGSAWRTWTLTLVEDPNQVVASCETFEKPILISDKAGVRKERGYGIASVYTNPQYRGQRMAVLLLNKLKEWLDEEGNGYLSVLYSDIGSNFYAKLGWTPFSTFQLVLEGEGQDISEQEGPRHSEDSLLKQVRPLKGNRLKALCEQDIDTLTHEFLHAPKENKTNSLRVAFLPSLEQVSWHSAREDFNSRAISLKSPAEMRGLISESGRSWLLWHLDIPEQKCKVQRVVLLDKDERERNVNELVSLLYYTLVQAGFCGIFKVVIWNPLQEIVAAANLLMTKFTWTKTILEERDSSIPSLRLRCGKPTDGVVWESNEYYAWC